MKPNDMPKNGKIYLIAPSFGCTTFPYKQRLERAIENLTMAGYTISVGPNCWKNEGFLASSSPEARALEFMNAYKSKADAIISVGGGELMCEILPFIDFEKLKGLKPKWFVGFSDNTHLTYTLTTILDIETIYGANAPSFYEYPFSYNTLDTLLMLNGKKDFIGYPQWAKKEETDNPFPPLVFTEEKKIIPYNYNDPFSGVLLGGCLDCLGFLCGTKYDKTKEYIEKHKNEGIIYYFEACDLYPIDIRRTLFRLKETGWFNHIKGFLIGRSYHYEEDYFGIKPQDMYYEMLKEYNVPILLDIDLGHLDPSMPIRNGAYATIELVDNNISFKYKN